MTKCRTCGNDYEPNARDIQKSDFQCHQCKREYMKEWRERRKAIGNPVQSTKMPREYHARYEREYFSSEENRSRRNANAKQYRNGDLRHHHEARWAVSHAIASGSMIKRPCEICGEAKVDAHHDDYSKPLEVRWLCRKHHNELHAKAKGE